jgi:NAD+-dependent secondary alcohol dehydrogenase Adh1
MKAARLYAYDPELKGPEFLTIEEVPAPSIVEPDEAIVRIGGAGLCRTDLHIIQGLWEQALVVDPPYVLGHENAGWVEEVGPSVRRVRPGDPVLVSPALSDGTCPACRRGDDNQCESLVWLGIQRDGGFAEFVSLSERNLFVLPEGLDPVQAAPLADAGLTAYHAAKKAARILTPDAFAVVIGVGGLGHMGLQTLRVLTPARIIAVERSELALGLARELGADAVLQSSDRVVEEVLELTGGKGAEVVLDFVGEGDVPDQAFAMLRTGGSYFVIGYGGSIHVPTMEIMAAEKSIIGNIGGTATELRELVALAGTGNVRMSIQTHPLERINEAITDLHQLRVKGRGVLIP